MNRLLFILTLCASAPFAIAGAPEGHPAVTAADRALHSGGSTGLPNVGKVLETMNAGGYTYLYVEDKGKKQWIAGNQINVKEGDVVSFSKGSLMRNFHSKTLDRTFPEILFTAKIQLEGAHPTPSSMQAAAGGAQNLNRGRVLNTMNSGGYTYIEVDQDGQTHWLASPQVTVKTGDTIVYADGSVMKNFRSKTLDREFPEIIFVGEVRVVAQ
ncbi:MAG TPA: hypothetical protein ENI99_08960 [Sedimenticola sp.]|nr:hypothetical protein [Sedimenticola sp.]